MDVNPHCRIAIMIELIKIESEQYKLRDQVAEILIRNLETIKKELTDTTKEC